MLNPEAYSNYEYEMSGFGMPAQVETIELGERPRNEFEYVAIAPRLHRTVSLAPPDDMFSRVVMERMIVENIRVVYKEWVSPPEPGDRGYWREYISYIKVPQIGDHDRHVEEIADEIAHERARYEYEMYQIRMRQADQRSAMNGMMGEGYIESMRPSLQEEPEPVRLRNEEHFDQNLFNMENDNEL